MAGDNQDQDQSSVLELSDEEFMKQGGSFSAPAASTTSSDEDEEARLAREEEERKAAEDAAQAAAAANANATNEGDDDEEAARKAAEEAAAQAAQAGTEGTDPAAGKAADDANANGDGAAKRGPDGKFVKQDTKAGEQDPAGKGTEGTDDGKAADPQGKADAAGVVDYKTQYEELLKPFKANGRDIKVESVDEARRLMQMGANYNKKMAGMKPHLAILKMLENNALLDPTKLSFLIDLDKKNPEAISKLVKDAGIDPLDISAEKAGGYTPGNHKVHDTEVELDQVLDEMKDSPKRDATLDLVGNQWDAKSKQMIAGHPQMLKVINGHMESGIYDLIATEMERKKLFGGLNGLSDLEAYRQVGDAMAADGKFDHILKPAGQPGAGGQQTPVAKTVVQPSPKKADDSKREEQRRAAAPAKGAAPTGKAKMDFDPLSLPDEEFAKLKPNF